MTRDNPVDPLLQRDIDSIAPAGMLIGHRLISHGDEHALLDQEATSIVSHVVEARRASGAARIVARALLARLGFDQPPVPRGVSGAPIWPAGIAGSMAHDDRVAVAAVGPLHDFAAIGIDVEPATPLPAEMLQLVATSQELRQIADDPLGGKILFTIKEAIYKALYPLDGIFLEFQDILVDLAARRATTRTGHAVSFRCCVSSHLVVLAWLQADPAQL